MTELYLIQGSSGSYEDYREWIVEAYLDKSKALETIEKLNSIQLEYEEKGKQIGLKSNNNTKLMSEEEYKIWSEVLYDENHPFIIVKTNLIN